MLIPYKILNIQCILLAMVLCYLVDFQNLFILHTWNFIPFDHNLPIAPSPQPLTTTILLSVSMCWAFYVRHISEIMQCLSFCVCLISLSEMFRFIHVVTNGRIFFSSFLRLNNILLCGCMYVCVSHFLYWWTFKLFTYLGYCE